jgi:hypothetical protein
MIFFVILGVSILIVSFIIAFVSLIREQREHFNVKTSADSSSLQNGEDSSRAEQKLEDSVSEQLVQPVESGQPDINGSLSKNDAVSRVALEDHLETTATEAFPWEQKVQDAFDQSEDSTLGKGEAKSPQKLRGEISLRDIISKSENQ